MISHQFSSAVLGIALGFAILLLVRRDHLQLGHALFWLGLAAASVVFGLFPALSDRIGNLVGISYGPTLVMLIAIAALILRTLQADIHATRLERRIRRLTQRLAILESDIAGARDGIAHDPAAANRPHAPGGPSPQPANEPLRVGERGRG